MKRNVRNVLTLASCLLLGGTIAGGTSLLTSCSTTENGSLVIDSLPLKVNYNLDDTLDLTGLVVYGKKAYGDYLSNTESVLITDYTTNIKHGSKLANKGVFDIVVSKKGYGSTSFKISVGDIEVNKLVIRSLPRKLSYKVGDKFNLNGLSLSIAKFVNGVEEGNGTNLQEGEYQTSIKAGQVLDKEGSFLVEIYKEGYESVYFQISVLTENNDFVNIVNKLKYSKNYQMEIYNTVGTTVDENGFHYKELVTENYFEKIVYQKSQADEPEDLRGLSIQSDIAYVNYDKGVYQVDLKNRIEETNDPKPGKVLSGKTKWYEADLVTIFNAFDPATIPTTTKNGKFVIEVILDEGEREANVGVTNEDWTKSLEANPFADKFLAICGWSDSLISILSTIEIETNGETYINIRGNLGGYGYTTLNVSGIGSTKEDDLDAYVARTDRSFDTSIDDCVKQPKLLELFTSKISNYTQTLNGTDANGNHFTSMYIYYGDNFVWFEPTSEFRRLYYLETKKKIGGSGFIAVSSPNETLATLFADTGLTSDGTGIYALKTTTTSNATNDQFKDTLTIDKSHFSILIDYVNGANVKAEPSSFKSRTYDCPVLPKEGIDAKYIFEEIGGLIDPSVEPNYASTWFLETRLSTNANPFIISYEPKVLETLCENILGKGSYNKYKSQFNSAVICPTYEIDETTKEITKVSAIELWCINLNTYRGFVSSLTELNETNLPDHISAVLAEANITL